MIPSELAAAAQPTAPEIPPHPDAPKAPQLDHRYDARLKVTGAAKYAAEFPVKNAAYGYLVQSTIPAGSISAIDTSAASHAAGVIAVMTPFNALKVKAESNVTVLQDTKVLYNGQPVAVVIARSMPEAMHAATLLRITYKPTPARLDFDKLMNEARVSSRGHGAAQRGDVEPALREPRRSSTRSTPRRSRTTTRWSRTPPSPPGRTASSLFTTPRKGSRVCARHWCRPSGCNRTMFM